jgi:hypothetical protein
LLYVVTSHFLAGGVTGSIFKVRMLLLVLSFVLVEFVFLTLLQGGISIRWAGASLLAVQAGYVAGVYMRAFREHVGYSLPRVRKRGLF